MVETFPPRLLKGKSEAALGCTLAGGGAAAVYSPGRLPAGQTGTPVEAAAGVTFVLTKRPAVRGPMAGSGGHRGASAGPAAMILQRKLVNYSDWFLSSPFRALISLRILKWWDQGQGPSGLMRLCPDVGMPGLTAGDGDSRSQGGLGALEPMEAALELCPVSSSSETAHRTQKHVAWYLSIVIFCPF